MHISQEPQGLIAQGLQTFRKVRYHWKPQDFRVRDGSVQMLAPAQTEFINILRSVSHPSG